MECNFYVGQEVVCINDDPTAPPNANTPGDLDGLKKGRIYTVESVYIDPRHDIPCITVVEIQRWPLLNYPHGYFAFRFRPLKKTTTDISEFERILKTKVLEDVE